MNRTGQQQVSPPPNIPVSPYVYQRLTAIRDEKMAELGRKVTFSEAIERLLDVYDEVVPG